MKKCPIIVPAILALLLAATDRQATAQVYTEIFSFDGKDGATLVYPNVLTQGHDGKLYSTTLQGGNSSSGGVVFNVVPDGAQAGKQTVLYRFSFGDAHGYQPWSGLTLGRDGSFYGAASEGGLSGCPEGCGTIFKITSRGVITTLHQFTGGADGLFPIAPPIQGVDGSFYGVAAPANAYKINESGVFTVLPAIPGYPLAPLMQANNGDFYGTTYRGGTDDGGTIYRMSPAGANTVVYNFGWHDEAFPIGGVIEGNDGRLYTTAQAGGSNRNGVIVRLLPGGAGATLLHNFGDPNFSNDGASPTSGLVQATDGNFYGVTCCGGNVGTGYGVIYEVSADGIYSILYNFDSINGAEGYSSLMQATDGKLYGLTQAGGLYGSGTLYSLDLGLPPFIKLDFPVGRVGHMIGILGQGLTGTTGVFFNGTSASFTVVSDTYLTATVPAGATSGYVTVTTADGTLTSNQRFHVAP